MKDEEQEKKYDTELKEEKKTEQQLKNKDTAERHHMGEPGKGKMDGQFRSKKQ